jgi:YD repeat-containing protein
LPETIVDPNGVTTTLTYDARQRLLTGTIAKSQGPRTASFSSDRVPVRIVRSAAPEIGLADKPGSFFISAGEVRGHEIVWIPQGVYDRLNDQPVSLEIKYSLRLRQASQAQSLPIGGDQWIEGLGRCATRIHEGVQIE